MERPASHVSLARLGSVCLAQDTKPLSLSNDQLCGSAHLVKISTYGTTRALGGVSDEIVDAASNYRI